MRTRASRGIVGAGLGVVSLLALWEPGLVRATEPALPGGVVTLFADDAPPEAATSAAEETATLGRGFTARHVELARSKAAREGKLVRRHRPVRVNALNLQSTQSVSIALFDGQVVTARRDRLYELSNRRVWFGHLDGDASSTVRLTDRSGVLSGGVVSRGGVYWLKHAADGVYALEEIDRTAFPADGEPVRVAAPLAAAASSAAANALTESAIRVDGYTDVDLLVLYTAVASYAAGGDASIVSEIETEVDNANLALWASGVQINLNLLLAQRVEIDWETEQSGEYLDDLREGRGALSFVPSLRNEAGADLVALIVEGLGGEPGVGGRAFCGPGANDAFSVTMRTGLGDGNWALTHEIGHNLGGGHDRENGSCDWADYAHGYRTPGVLSTIMAYPCSPEYHCEN